MGTVKLKPTSPGRRGTVKVLREGIYKGRPYKDLVEPKRKISGRNNAGRITVRHRGGAHKRHYRVIDFKRTKDGIPGKVERIEYDPNRSAHIALILYQDGERRYIICPKNLTVGDLIESGSDAQISTGNCLPIRNIPVGSVIHCIEMMPAKGAQIARSAGAYAQLLAKDGQEMDAVPNAERSVPRLESRSLGTLVRTFSAVISFSNRETGTDPEESCLSCHANRVGMIPWQRMVVTGAQNSPDGSKKRAPKARC